MQTSILYVTSDLPLKTSPDGQNIIDHECLLINGKEAFCDQNIIDHECLLINGEKAFCDQNIIDHGDLLINGEKSFW